MATCIYLLDTLALRPGGAESEESDDIAESNEGPESDVSYGLFTLLAEHVKLISPNKLHFHFTGKDLVVYDNIVTVPSNVYSAMAKILKNKNKDEQIFDKSIVSFFP